MNTMEHIHLYEFIYEFIQTSIRLPSFVGHLYSFQVKANNSLFDPYYHRFLLMLLPLGTRAALKDNKLLFLVVVRTKIHALSRQSHDMAHDYM